MDSHLTPTKALAAALKHCEGDIGPAGLHEGLVAVGMTVMPITDAPLYALVRLSLGGEADPVFDAVIFVGTEGDCEQAAYYEPDRVGYKTRIVTVEREAP